MFHRVRKSSVRRSPSSDQAADVDLYLFQDVKGLAVLRGSSTGSGAVKNVSVFSPAAGQWKVVVDAYNLPSGSTTYSYIDTFKPPGFRHDYCRRQSR